MGNMLPDRHPNRDFFILDVSDAAPKDDMASMEHPIFSLSVKPDMRELEYQHDGKRVIVVPSGKGLATIMDKDILLYCISKLVHCLNAGEKISPWVDMTAREVMVSQGDSEKDRPGATHQ
jgi:plasmid replication initiation protein